LKTKGKEKKEKAKLPLAPVKKGGRWGDGAHSICERIGESKKLAKG